MKWPYFLEQLPYYLMAVVKIIKPSLQNPKMMSKRPPRLKNLAVIMVFLSAYYQASKGKQSGRQRESQRKTPFAAFLIIFE